MRMFAEIHFRRRHQEKLTSLGDAGEKLAMLPKIRRSAVAMLKRVMDVKDNPLLGRDL